MKRVLALLLMVCILCAGWAAATAAPFFVPFSPVDGLFYGMPKEEALSLVEAEGWQFDYAVHEGLFYYHNVKADQYIVPTYSLAFFLADSGEVLLNSVEYIFAVSPEGDIPPKLSALYNELEQKLTALYGHPTSQRLHSAHFQQENIVFSLSFRYMFTYNEKPYRALRLFCYPDSSSPPKPSSSPLPPSTAGF